MILPKLTAELSLKPSKYKYHEEPPIDPAWFSNSSLSPDLISMQACSWSGGPEPLIGEGQAFSADEADTSENIFAIGAFHPLFPSLCVEKEFYQAADLEYTRSFVTQTSNEFLFGILDKAENLYIAKEMCWVFSVEGIDIYVVKPGSNMELTSLIGSIAKRKNTTDLDVVVGNLGPMSKPEQCNGLCLPTISCTQAFTFTYRQMVQRIMAATGATEEEADEIYRLIHKLTDNSGRGDVNRAVNFLVLYSIDIYIATYNMMHGEEAKKLDPEYFELTNVMTKLSHIQGEQNILDVIFVYRGKTTNVSQKWFCRVDVTGRYPYQIGVISIYYDRP